MNESIKKSRSDEVEFVFERPLRRYGYGLATNSLGGASLYSPLMWRWRTVKGSDGWVVADLSKPFPIFKATTAEPPKELSAIWAAIGTKAEDALVMIVGEAEAKQIRGQK